MFGSANQSFPQTMKNTMAPCSRMHVSANNVTNQIPNPQDVIYVRKRKKVSALMPPYWYHGRVRHRCLYINRTLTLQHQARLVGRENSCSFQCRQLSLQSVVTSLPSSLARSYRLHSSPSPWALAYPSSRPRQTRQ